MNTENLIFVCYYPGCCGQFMGGLCDILLNNKGSPFVRKTGDVVRIMQRHLTGLETLMNDEFISIASTSTWTKEHHALFEKLIDEWKITPNPRQTHYVVTSHILAIKELQEKFKQNKIILLIPKDQDEIDLSCKLWDIKNIPLGQPAFEKPSYHLTSLGSLNEYSAKSDALVFNLSEILNDQNIDNNINKIINHLGVTDEYKLKAVDFYKEYLKKQQISLIF